MLNISIHISDNDKNIIFNLGFYQNKGKDINIVYAHFITVLIFINVRVDYYLFKLFRDKACLIYYFRKPLRSGIDNRCELI